MLPGTADSYWLATTPSTDHPPLDRDIEVDVAVVGGGVAGICTAWELAVAGRRVALLEADRVAAAVTGHTTAKVSALHTFRYADLRRSFGPAAAAQYAQSQQEAVERVAAVVARLGIDCDLERLPAYSYVESATGTDLVRAEVEAAQQAGLAASYVTETGLPFPVAAAVRVEDQAQFHPRRYLLGLVADLLSHGGQVFEASRVVRLHPGDPCTLRTAAGATVRAGDVVVATHYPVFDRGLMFARLTPRRELVVAAAIPAEDDPGGMYITPEQNTRSVRTAPLGDGQRLLVVTGEHFSPGEGDVTRRWERLLAWTQSRFPRAQVRYRWAAQDNTSTDQVPYVGPFHPGARHVYVAAGFGGWGMTSGVMAGRLLAATLTGSPPPWAQLYDPRRLHPARDAKPMLAMQAKVAKTFVSDRLHGSGVASAADLAPGSGAVLRVGVEQRAVYRDEAGALHALSARCTHLGCLVRFNDAERTWECPCHGSRFAVSGEVLQGPANSPLRAADLPDAAGEPPG